MSGRELLEQLENTVKVAGDNCVIWPREAKNKYGYPNTITVGSRTDGSRRKAMPYRLMYELVKGPVPMGMHLDHLCRQPGCINPSHLEAVTQAENNRRALPFRDFTKYGSHQRTKTHCPQGHEYTEENTHRKYRLSKVTDKKIWSRNCKTCDRLWHRKATK